LKSVQLRRRPVERRIVALSQLQAKVVISTLAGRLLAPRTASAPKWAGREGGMRRTAAALMLMAGVAGACTAPAQARRDTGGEAREPAGATASPARFADGPAAVPHASQFRLHSKLLDRDFEIYVSEPVDPDDKEKSAAVYSLDGDSSFAMAAEIARRLEGAGEITPAYVIGIGYGAGENRRDHDYVHAVLPDTPGTGGGADFERFLVGELKPLIERRYPVDPKKAILAGHSYGGLFAASVLTREPNAFQGWLISSASLWAADQATVAAARPLARAGRGHGEKVYLSVGEREGPVMIDPIRAFAAALSDRASGFSVQSQVWDGETHASVVPFAYSRGLRMLLPPPAYGR
jgi:predicted alpha/beta superfamily hydrolase